MESVGLVHPPAAGRHSHMDPVGCPVRRSKVALWIHQGLEENRTDTESSFPMESYLPGCQRQHCTGKIFDSDPRKNKEPAVAHNLLEILTPCPIVPVDPLIPGPHPPGRTRELQTSYHRLRLRNADQVAYMSPEGNLVPKIMISADQLPPQQSFLLAPDQTQRYRRYISYSTCNRRLRFPIAALRHLGPGATGTPSPAGRQPTSRGTSR